MKNVFYKVCEIIYSNFSVITPRNLDILLNDNKSNMKSLQTHRKNKEIVQVAIFRFLPDLNI